LQYQAILIFRLFCRSKITQDDFRNSVDKLKKPRLDELARTLAKNGRKMSGWRQDLVLGETVRAADTAEIGHVVGRSYSQQGAHFFKEVVNNKTGGVVFRVYFGELPLMGDLSLKKNETVSLNHGTQNCEGEVVIITRFMIPLNLRRKGHGEVVLRHLIALYRKAGAVRLKIPVSTPQGRRLYSKCGFTTDFTRTELSLDLQAPSAGVIRARPPRRAAAVSNIHCGGSDVPVSILAVARERGVGLQARSAGVIRARPPRRAAAASNIHCGGSDVPVSLSAVARERGVGLTSSANATGPRIPTSSAGKVGMSDAALAPMPPDSAAIQLTGPEVIYFLSSHLT